jgi:uncharacterized membrane protein
MLVCAVGFGFMGLSHLIGVPLAQWIKVTAPHFDVYSLTSDFFWIVVLATTFGLIASFKPARRLEGVGASKVGTVLLYFLVASIGGAASAPVVAGSFHPALAPVGVLLAVLGYALGTYGGWLAGQLMRWVAQ